MDESIASHGARARLDALRWAWVVYAVFCTIVELARDGVDSDSLVAAGIRIGLTFAFATLLTRWLVQKSSLVWAFAVVFALLNVIAAGIVIVEILVEAGDGGELAVAALLLSGASAYINVRTFRALRHRDVKRHVMLDG